MERHVVFFMSVFWLTCSFVSGDDVKAELDRAYGKAVAGDIRPILSVLGSIENLEQSKYAELNKKYEKRFIAANELVAFDDPFVTRLYSSGILKGERFKLNIAVCKLKTSFFC